MKNYLTRLFLALPLLITGIGLSVQQISAQEPIASDLPVGERGMFEIGVGEARLLPIAGIPKTIIVGDDTTIAANIIQDDILVFTGIAHGKTNVIVLNSSGQIIEQVWVSVIKSGAPLTVRRGMSTEKFRCNPACRPEDQLPVAPTSGDAAAVPG